MNFQNTLNVIILIGVIAICLAIIGFNWLPVILCISLLPIGLAFVYAETRRVLRDNNIK